MAPTYPSKSIAPPSRTTQPNPNPGAKRSIVTVNMDDVVFVLLEDPDIAPTHGEADEQRPGSGELPEYVRLCPTAWESGEPAGHAQSAGVPSGGLHVMDVKDAARIGASAAACDVSASIDQGTMISNFLASIIPVVPDANIYAVTVGEEQRAGLLWDREEERRKKEEQQEEEEKERLTQSGMNKEGSQKEPHNDDDF
ncbi:hypothetical protein EST38_g7316 [Candolleomyces aberdarensis]|uniref:Uncharacterized protein n=1 Tax=Candolleomyces aberdarensis TaxID=2316362 RepID=A0A4V1Q3G8_9AGAR|nr:hypothetical protein EST38_g7316 [Candolleomyces aberdarensis]